MIKLNLIEKIKRGLRVPIGLKILHTAPHPDDVMLAYHSYVVRLMESNDNYFAYFTNGFRAVSSSYIVKLLEKVDCDFINWNQDDIFQASYEQILEGFERAFCGNNSDEMRKIEQQIFLRGVVSVFKLNNVDVLLSKVKSLREECRLSEVADSLEIQKLKGFLRESESDRMWHIHGVVQDKIFHLRSRFYTTESFDEEKDITITLKLIDKIDPDIITVLIDPKNVGPKTHYKTLQLLSEIFKRKKGKNFDPEIWGYRNVWHCFELEEADIVISVSQKELEKQDQMFKKCFATQRVSLFPSPLDEGPFSELSCKIQREQFSVLKGFLGSNFFKNHEDKKLRDMRGAIFLKKMDVEKFLAFAEEEAQK